MSIDAVPDAVPDAVAELQADNIDAKRRNEAHEIQHMIGTDLDNMPPPDGAPHTADTPEVGPPSTPRETWHRVDFTDLVRRFKAGEIQRPQPTMLHRSDGLSILYPGKDHALIGASEAGKTWVAMVAALEVFRAGGAVVWADWEDDDETFLLRWVDIGGDPDDMLSDRLHYINPTGDPGTWPELVKGAELVIIDTVEESAATMGYQTNERHEYSAWNRVVVRTALAAGAAVLIIDHVPKAKRGDPAPREGIGTVVKLNKIRGAVFMLESITPFAVGRGGRSRLTISKDRGGALGDHAEGKRRTLAEVVFSSDGDELTVTLDPPKSSTGDDGGFRPTWYMEKVSAWAAGQMSHWSKNAAQKDVSGKNDRISEAVERLAAEGYLSTETGPGGHPVYGHVKPFTGAADEQGKAG